MIVKVFEQSQYQSSADRNARPIPHARRRTAYAQHQTGSTFRGVRIDRYDSSPVMFNNSCVAIVPTTPCQSATGL